MVKSFLVICADINTPPGYRKETAREKSLIPNECASWDDPLIDDFATEKTRIPRTFSEGFQVSPIENRELAIGTIRAIAAGTRGTE